MELITNDGFPYLKVPELSREEQNMPAYHFYKNYKLYPPNPLQQQILDEGPMALENAIPIENWLDHLQVHGYPSTVYGYTMMPEGYGFYIEYSVSPVTWQGKWRRWYGKWYNQHSKSMVPGQGNLRYKIWNPADHWDHRFVNGSDDKDGVWSMETLDLGETGDPSKGIGAISHNIDLRDYGLSEERYQKLLEADCRADACWEEFENAPGHHLVLRFSRPCPLGGRESINCEWIGFYAKDGKIIRDENTPVNEQYLKNVLTHNTIERQHLYEVLPDLYEAYKDLPIDAD